MLKNRKKGGKQEEHEECKECCTITDSLPKLAKIKQDEKLTRLCCPCNSERLHKSQETIAEAARSGITKILILRLVLLIKM